MLDLFNNFCEECTFFKSIFVFINPILYKYLLKEIILLLFYPEEKILLILYPELKLYFFISFEFSIIKSVFIVFLIIFLNSHFFITKILLSYNVLYLSYPVLIS